MKHSFALKRPLGRSARAVARKVQGKANVKVTGALHILRHTFCSRLAMLGASTMAIKELAGHQNISTTEKYMHLSPRAKDGAIDLLNGGAVRSYGSLTATEKQRPRIPGIRGL